MYTDDTAHVQYRYFLLPIFTGISPGSVPRYRSVGSYSYNSPKSPSVPTITCDAVPITKTGHVAIVHKNTAPQDSPNIFHIHLTIGLIFVKHVTVPTDKVRGMRSRLT